MKKPEVKEVKYLGFFETLDYVIEKFNLPTQAEPGGLTLKARFVWYMNSNGITGERGTLFPIPYIDIFNGEADATLLPADMHVLVNMIILEFDLTGENKDVLFKMDW